MSPCWDILGVLPVQKICMLPLSRVSDVKLDCFSFLHDSNFLFLQFQVVGGDNKARPHAPRRPEAHGIKGQ